MGRLTFLYQSNLPHRAIAVYMYLHDRANESMQCWPAIPTIAHELNLSVSTVKRALNDLIQAGYIRKESRYRKSGGNSSTLYTLMPPENQYMVLTKGQSVSSLAFGKGHDEPTR